MLQFSNRQNEWFQGPYFRSFGRKLHVRHPFLLILAKKAGLVLHLAPNAYLQSSILKMTLFWKKEEVTLDLGLIVMLVFAVRRTITASASDCNRELHRRYYSACKEKTQLLKNLGSFCRHDHLYLSELCCHQKTATECPFSDTMVLVIKEMFWKSAVCLFIFAANGKIAKQKKWKIVP